MSVIGGSRVVVNVIGASAAVDGDEGLAALRELPERIEEYSGIDVWLCDRTVEVGIG